MCGVRVQEGLWQGGLVSFAAVWQHDTAIVSGRAVGIVTGAFSVKLACVTIECFSQMDIPRFVVAC